MKRFVVAAIIIAALLAVVFAIGKFNQRTTPPFSIVGDWQVDSVYTTASVSDSIRQLTNSIVALSEERRYTLRFLADSTLLHHSTGDSLTGKYYLADSLLFIKSDSIYNPHHLSKTNNERIEIAYPSDSITLVLKRLP